MKAVDRKNQKTLFQMAGAALRAAPDLSAEYDRVLAGRRDSRRSRILIKFGIAMLGVFGLVAPTAPLYGLIHTGTYASRGADLILVAVSIFQTTVACVCAAHIHTRLRMSTWLTVMSALPVPDRMNTRRAWLVIVGFLTLALHPGLWAFGFVAYAEGLGPIGCCCALGLAAVQWVAAVAIGTFLAAHPRFFPLGVSGPVLFLFGIVYYFCRAPGLPAVAPVVYLFTPAGWISGIFKWACLEGADWAWWLLLPTGLTIAAGPPALRKLLREYKIREFTFRPGLPAIAESNWWNDHIPNIRFGFLRRYVRGYVRRLQASQLQQFSRVPATPIRRSIAIALDRIRQNPSRVTARESHVGYLDRYQRRWLTRREIDVWDFMTADSSMWSRVYPKVLITNLVALAVTLILPAELFRHDPGGLGVGLYVLVVPFSSLAGLLLGGGRWFGFGAPQFGGVCVPRFALLPIGFAEVSRIMVKVACARAILLLPLGLIIASTFCVAINGDWPGSLIAGVVAVGLYLVCQGLVIAARFADAMGHPITSRSKWYWQIARFSTSSVSAIASPFVGFIVLGSTIGILHDFELISDAVLPYIGAFLALLVLVWPWVAWLSVRAMYRRGIVDLARTSQSIGQQALRDFEKPWHSPR